MLSLYVFNSIPTKYLNRKYWNHYYYGKCPDFHTFIYQTKITHPSYAPAKSEMFSEKILHIIIGARRVVEKSFKEWKKNKIYTYRSVKPKNSWLRSESKKRYISNIEYIYLELPKKKKKMKSTFLNRYIRFNIFDLRI